MASLNKSQRLALAVCHAHGSLFSRHGGASRWSSRRGTRHFPDSVITSLEAAGLATITFSRDGRRARLTDNGVALIADTTAFAEAA